MMKLGELQYLYNHIFYHIYNTCLGYETLSTSRIRIVGMNQKHHQAERPSEDATACTTATTKA
jgi:hypothetical protein